MKKTPARRKPAKPAAGADARLTKGGRTRAAIKAAIAELIAQRQSLDFTLEDICAKTGFTIGAFYFHFANKDAALEEMAIDHVAEFYGAIADRGAAEDLEGLSRLILRASIDACVRNPAMFRANYILVPKSMDVYRAWIEARKRVVALLLGRLAERRGRAGKPAPIDYLDVHLLLSGLEGFLENLYFGDDSTMRPITKRPQRLEEEMWAHWRPVLFRPAKVE
ncbi:MAG: TetR/AcrR family transcriptional regulator [Hyphomonadaceae bacterium]|nr:TetR/AcrR family transcriptional regulator [Hyphomonadaceae bacterium]